MAFRPAAALFLTALAMPLAASDESGRGALTGEPQEAVRAEFSELCRQLREGSLEFYSVGPSVEIERALGRSGLSTTERRRLQGALGEQYLHLGRQDEAIALLEQAIAGGPDALPKELRVGAAANLVLAHLQATEDANCVMHGNPWSCILPIRAESVHRITAEHARVAGTLALDLLSVEPKNIQLAWLLNLARMLTGDWPDGVPEALRLPKSAFVSAEPFPAWRDRSADIGFDRVDLAGGAIMDDFDGDGLLDLVTSTWDPCGSLQAFRSTGDGRFEDVSAAWGLDAQLGGLNVTHADYDGDGRLDLLVLRGGWLFAAGRIRKSLLRNDLGGAAGRFVDVTRAAGLAEPAYPSQAAAWADYDGDGDLDLYSGNESSGDQAYPSQLYRNEGDGRFTEVAAALGLANGRMAKGVAWGDYDDDGDPDLYVSNHGLNRLYRNDRDRFTDVAAESGAIGPDGWTFASWFFDWDNDGDLDLWVGDYRAPVEAIAASYFGAGVPAGHPHLFRNDGGRFTEVSEQVGLVRPLLPMGANFGDLDNDGWLDVYVGTGHPSFQSLMPNVMYRNVGGTRFADVTFAGGFGHLQKGHGVAWGDLDNDGDQDLLHQLGGFYPADAYRDVLFENPGPARSWITLRLEGRRANRFGVGARVAVRTRGPGGERTIHALAGTGGSFGGSSHQLELGLGDAEAIEELVIHWPGSGTEQRFTSVPIGRVLHVVEGEPRLRVVELPRFRLGG